MAVPTTSILDSFTRANESPLAGNWTQPVYDSTTARLRLVSNVLASDAGLANAAAYWNLTNVGPDCEVYSSFSAPAGAIYVFARLQTPGSAACDGYAWQVNTGGGSNQLYRIDNGVFTGIGSNGGLSGTEDGLWLQVVGSALTGYMHDGGVWTVNGTAVDSTYALAGKLGIEIDDPSAGNTADNFGGGTIIPPPSGPSLILSQSPLRWG
jgi:hypothetical protein